MWASKYCCRKGIKFICYSLWCLGSSQQFALFVFKVRFRPNNCSFSKAVCVNPWNHSNENKSLTHSWKFFFKPCKIFDHSWAISDNPFGCVLPLVHSTFQAASNPRGSRVKNLFLGKSLVYVFLWEVTYCLNWIVLLILGWRRAWHVSWRWRFRDPISWSHFLVTQSCRRMLCQAGRC